VTDCEETDRQFPYQPARSPLVNCWRPLPASTDPGGGGGFYCQDYTDQQQLLLEDGCEDDDGDYDFADCVCNVPTGGGGTGGSGGSSPSVKPISGPSVLPISYSGATNTISLKSIGSPDGGTYSWTSSLASFTLTPTDESTVTLSSTTPGTSTITMTYAVSGEGGGQASATQNVTVQVPTTATLQAASTVTTAYSNQTAEDCSGNNPQPNEYGYQSCVYYQIGDQNTPSAAILGTYTANEQVTTVSENYVVTNQQGNHSSNNGGVFADMLHVLRASALPSDLCVIEKQTFTVNASTIRVNCLQFTPTAATVTDITATPNACTMTTCN
jgi:hypothetical protein